MTYEIISVVYYYEKNNEWTPVTPNQFSDIKVAFTQSERKQYMALIQERIEVCGYKFYGYRMETHEQKTVLGELWAKKGRRVLIRAEERETED